MAAENNSIQETVQAPERLITLEKPLPGPFVGAQEVCGKLPREFTAKAKGYGQEYA